MNDVYINRVSKFLPGNAIENDEMEEYLGFISDEPSRSKRIVLRNNKITKRYYALDKEGNSTHSNAQLCAEAVNGLIGNGVSLEDISVLACGTSSPDSIIPSHASLVHGEVGNVGMEAISPSGACNAGMLAMKYAAMTIMTGQADNAVSVGSEKTSTFLKANNFKEESAKLKELDENAIVAFEKDFLRWMLSDGAAAFLLQNKPNDEGISLKVDWIENKSFAHEVETCMYAGGEKDSEGNFISWRDFDVQQWTDKSLFSIKQDVKLLDANIVEKGNEFLLEVMKKHNFTVDDFDYFLPHISSMFFKQRVYDIASAAGVVIPWEKWFINLPSVGNVGAGSIYLMVEELFNSGKLEKGQKLFLMVPESARFSYSYAMLTVV